MNGLLHRRTHRSVCFHVQLWTKKVLNLNLLHVESFYRSSLNRLEESCHSVGDRMHVAMHGHFVFYRTIVFLTQVKFKKLESNAFITSTSVSSTRAELFSNRSFVVCLIFHILTFSLDSTTMYSFTLQIFFTYIFCSPCVTLSISEGQLSFWRQIFDKVDVTSFSRSRILILIDRHLKPSVQSGHRLGISWSNTFSIVNQSTLSISRIYAGFTAM